MNRLARRFAGIMEPALHRDRLQDPARRQSGAKIFVGSSGDMWGHWVPKAWIDAVLFTCRQTRRHTYQFLTKNPWRYAQDGDFVIDNGWYGTTVDGTPATAGNLLDLQLATNGHCRITRFVSFEPLLGPVELGQYGLFGIAWVIIGANSNRGAPKPPDAWADAIIAQARQCGAAVWVKDNYRYRERIKEWPG